MKYHAMIPALAAAILLSMAPSKADAAFPAPGQLKTLWCYPLACPPSHYVDNEYSVAEGRQAGRYPYRAVQWVGGGYSCSVTTNNGYPCPVAPKTSTTGTQTWQTAVGVEFTGTVKDVAALKGSWVGTNVSTVTNTVEYATPLVTVAVGQTLVPYSYVYRDPMETIYLGYWVRSGEPVTCIWIFKCQSYTFSPSFIFFRAKHDKSREIFQTVELLLYTTSQTSGLLIEKD